MKRRKEPAVPTIPATATVVATAERMRERGVDSLVVVGARGKAIGLVTDRDLALRVAAARLDPKRTRVRKVMSAPLVAATADESNEGILARMERHGVRHIPVLDAGKVARIVTFDELLLELGEEIADLGHAVRR